MALTGLGLLQTHGMVQHVGAFWWVEIGRRCPFDRGANVGKQCHAPAATRKAAQRAALQQRVAPQLKKQEEGSKKGRKEELAPWVQAVSMVWLSR